MPRPARRLTTLLLACAFGLAFVASASVPALASQDEGAGQGPEVAEPAAPRQDLLSPRATMRAFLDAVETLAQPDLSDQQRETAERTIAAAFNRGADAPRQTLRDDAARLLGVLNRLGGIERDALRYTLPDERAVERSGTDAFRFLPHESPMHRDAQSTVLAAAPHAVIAFERRSNGEWVFTEASLTSLGANYSAVSELPVIADAPDETAISGSTWIEQRVPASWAQPVFLGIPGWKLAALVLVIVAGVALDFLVCWTLRLAWRRFEKRDQAVLTRRTLKMAVRPFGLLAMSTLWLIAAPYLGAPELAQAAIMVAIRLTMMVAAVWSAWRVADLVSHQMIALADRTETNVDDILAPIIRKALKLAALALGVIYGAESLDVRVLPLLTGLGIGGLAVAFAAKDTIENFFGSIAVILDKPFDIGDWVVIGEIEGTVEDIQIRSTRIRTFYNSLVTVPNASLVRANVDNYGRRRYRRIRKHLGLAYDTPPDRVEAFCEAVRELIRLHPYTRKDYYIVSLQHLGDSSLQVLLYAFFETPNWETELRERQRLLLDIMRVAERLGVEFAFPTRTVYVKRAGPDDAHREVKDAVPTPAGAESEALSHGRDAARAQTREQPWRDAPPPPFTFNMPFEDSE